MGKRKGSEDVVGVPEKKDKIREENKKITNPSKVKPIEDVKETKESELKLKCKDDDLPKETKEFMQSFSDCLTKNPEKSKLLFNEADEKVFKHHGTSIATYNNTIKKINTKKLNLLKEAKDNLEQIQRHKKILIDNKNKLQKSLHEKILKELCSFYLKHIDDPKPSFCFDSEISKLSEKLGKSLDSFVKLAVLKK